MDEHLSLNTAIVLTPRRAGVLDGQDNTVEVLLRVQAPTPRPGTRRSARHRPSRSSSTARAR